MAFQQQKISAFIEEFLPLYQDIVEDHPGFILFIRKYFEFLEQSNQIQYYLSNLDQIQDIDSTTDNFLNYFMDNFARYFPKNVRVEKRFLLKNIIDLYKKKGTIPGLETSFRAVYGEEVSVYLPKVDIVKTSDGRFDTFTVIIVEYPGYNQESTRLNLNSMLGYKVIKADDISSFGFISDIDVDYRQGSQVPVVKLYLTGVKGNLNTPSNVNIINFNDVSAEYTVVQFTRHLNLVDKGRYYARGDRLNIQSDGDNLNFVASVGDVNFGHIDEYEIIKGGSGYINGESVIVDNTGTNGSGFAANLIVDESGIITDLYITNYGSGYQYPPTLTLPSGNGGLISVSGKNVGSIRAIEIINPGMFDNVENNNLLGLSCYKFQTLTIDPNFNPTDYQNIEFSGIGSGILAYFDIDAGIVKLFETNTEANRLYNANLATSTDITMTGLSFRILDGYEAIVNPLLGYASDIRINTSIDQGEPSSSKKIQDSFYYQEWSYDVQSKIDPSEWSENIGKFGHVAGTKGFGSSYMIDKIQK